MINSYLPWGFKKNLDWEENPLAVPTNPNRLDVTTSSIPLPFAIKGVFEETVFKVENSVHGEIMETKLFILKLWKVWTQESFQK